MLKKTHELFIEEINLFTSGALKASTIQNVVPDYGFDYVKRFEDNYKLELFKSFVKHKKDQP